MFEIDKPIETISYTEEYGYYVSANNVKDLINNYIEAEEYDHIFVVVRLGNDNENNICLNKEIRNIISYK